jgi:hypothetical protein
MKIVNCKFENNTAAIDGGSLYLGDIDAEISSSTFNNNIAGKNGGATYLSCSPNNIKSKNYMLLAFTYRMFFHD